MNALDTLQSEHRLIEKAIDALVAFASEARRKDQDEKEELGRFVTFIRDFADARHHGKEEHLLFAAMIEAGFPQEGGPIAVMLGEHELGRGYAGELAALAEQPSAWTAGDRARLEDAAQGYGGLLRHHIQKEDAILYPMAEQRLPPEVMERVSRACDDFEAGGAADHDRLQKLAFELLARHAPHCCG